MKTNHIDSKSCLVCGVVFSRKQYENPLRFSRRKYCSRLCTTKGTILGKTGADHPRWKGHIQKICLTCGKNFEVMQYESYRKYCSKVCDKQHRKNVRIARDTVVCESCKKNFDRGELTKEGHGRFCSRLCVGKYLAIKFKGRPAMTQNVVWSKGEAHPNWRGMVPRLCKQCGKEFLVHPSDVKSTKSELHPASFCSRKCFGLGRRGKNSPVWKGGLLSETQYLRQKLHAMPEYKEWRQRIFRRDRGTCVLCKAIGKIEADHYPEPIAKIIKKHNLKTTEQARECSELWDILNGRTLCRPCHRASATFGRRRLKN